MLQYFVALGGNAFIQASTVVHTLNTAEPKGFEASVCAKESAVSLAVGVNYVANVKSLDVRKQKAHVTSRAWSCATMCHTSRRNFAKP